MLETLSILKYLSVKKFKCRQSAGNLRNERVLNDYMRDTLNGEDIVWSSWRHEESHRNDEILDIKNVNVTNT